MADCLVGMADEVVHFCGPGSKAGSGQGNHASCDHTGCSDSIAFPLTFQVVAADLAN